MPADVIAPHFKRRLSGVTSTIVQLVPIQNARGTTVQTFGPGLPASLPKLAYCGLWRLWSLPAKRPFRIWHARRNVEVVGGLLLRDVLRMKLKIVFTSASQRVHQPFTKWLISRVDAVVATSRKTAAYLTVPNTVILHGINTDRFCPADDKAAAKIAVGLDPAKRHIGCFGRVRHQKGTDLFLSAVTPLLKGNPNWVAVVAGRATAEHQVYVGKLKAAVIAEGLERNVLFVGEHRDIERWYRALDLFVAPQRWEGFGLTPLEAMASEVATVATDVGAFSELVVDGVTGVIVPVDTNALRDAIARYLGDPELLAMHSAAALTHVRTHFPIAREADALAEVYNALWDGGPKQGRAE